MIGLGDKLFGLFDLIFDCRVILDFIAPAAI
jgi:hypothetical protein